MITFCNIGLFLSVNGDQIGSQPLWQKYLDNLQSGMSGVDHTAVLFLGGGVTGRAYGLSDGSCNSMIGTLFRYLPVSCNTDCVMPL